jgi:hypothetical protein
MERRVAVFVDGDNLSPDLAPEVRRHADELGTPFLRRVYCNATQLKGWEKRADFLVVHSGSGKNATDLLLAVDAMEIAFSGRCDSVVIASSDRDFRHLATRLRERGLTVVGVGDNRAPDAFRDVCTRFVELGAEPPRPGTTVLDRQIRKVVEHHGQNNQGMRLTELNPIMRNQHDVLISSHPEKNWRKYLGCRPNLYDLDPKGPEARVRIKPGGFA